MSSRLSSDQRTPPEDDRWSFWWRFLCGCFLGAMVVLIVALAVGHARGFFGLVFWQQLMTTFVGAGLALASAVWLYCRQERARSDARRRAELAQEASRVKAVLGEIRRNRTLVPSIRNTQPKDLHIHLRMSLLVSEGCLVSLLQQSGDVELYAEVGVLLDSYRELNRCLDAYSRSGLADAHMRTELRQQLRSPREQQLAQIVEATDRLDTRLDHRLDVLQRELTE